MIWGVFVTDLKQKKLFKSIGVKTESPRFKMMEAVAGQGSAQYSRSPAVGWRATASITELTFAPVGFQVMPSGPSVIRFLPPPRPTMSHHSSSKGGAASQISHAILFKLKRIKMAGEISFT
jgi:hypothetical protein